MANFPVAQLTGGLIKAARALLGMSSEELAKEASIGVATVRRAEATSGNVKLTTGNALRLVEALERRGLVLMAPDQHGGVGARLRR